MKVDFEYLLVGAKSILATNNFYISTCPLISVDLESGLQLEMLSYVILS